MSPLTLDQAQLGTLSQLLATGGHSDVHELLRTSLKRLVEFWPAQAGALLYLSPQGELVRLEHGALNSEARTLIDQARTSFARRNDDREPTVGFYALEGGFALLELQLQSSSHRQGVGLIHLVVPDSGEKNGSTTTLHPDEDLLLLLVRSIGGEADKMITLQRAERDLRELRLLYEVGQSLAINLDLPSLLRDITRRAPAVVDAERCSVFILDEERYELVLESTPPGRPFRMPADRGIAGWVMTHGLPQVVNDVEQDARWYRPVIYETEVVSRSLVCVPMRVGERVIGVMQLLNKKNGDTFTEQDVQLLTTLAAQAGIAIENARLYRKLQEENERLLNKESQVRNAIARDLHDGPTQRLTAVQMNIQFIKKLLVAMPERVGSELDTLSDLVNKTITDIRTFLFELRPLGLEAHGLLPTLQQYVERWCDPSGRDIQLRLEAPPSVPRLSLEVEAAAFMIIQEAINNARKHADTPEIAVYLYIEETHLVASVWDRGKGFDVRAVEANYESRGSLGLVSMKERAQLIKADIRFRSEPGQGTTVELRIPLT